MNFDPIGMLAILDRHRVRHVVIGGLAAAAHGSPSVTQDLDICYDRDPENLGRLAAALHEVRARLRGAEEEVPFILDARTFQGGGHFTFTTDAGDLNCLGEPPGTNGYDDLATGASAMDFDGLRVDVASLDDLIRMKRAAGRPKDRVELEILGALREEMEGTTGS